MNRKVLHVIVAVCIVCIILRVVINRHKDSTPDPDVLIATAREASKTQGKLVVMRIFGTTTAYRESRAATKAKAQVGYVHEGSADIAVDLTKSEFYYQEVDGEANLRVVVPCPELDYSSVGIDPAKLRRVTSIPRTNLRRQDVFTELEEECKKVIVDNQRSTFASVDVIDAAKIQARRVLTNFYRECVDGKIVVDVEFKGEAQPYYLPNPDMTHATEDSTGKDR